MTRRKLTESDAVALSSWAIEEVTQEMPGPATHALAEALSLCPSHAEPDEACNLCAISTVAYRAK